MKIEVHPDDDVGRPQGGGDHRRRRARGGIVARALHHGGQRRPHAVADVARIGRRTIPWESVHVVQVDERVAPAGDPDRNLTHLRESLLDHAPLLPDHIHAMPVEAADLNRAAEQYAADACRTWRARRQCLISFISASEPDGHTASLVPGDPVLDVTDADVAVTGPYQGRRRMTLTFPIINRSRRVLWLVTGREKAGALVRLRDSDPSIPASRVRQDRRSCSPIAQRPDSSAPTRNWRRKNEAITTAAMDSPRPMTSAQLDQLSINCIRTLSMDAVQQAKSGHPGTPMALAPLVYTLWNRVMRFDPQDPIWPNRDRFVLSNGHASMLLWSVLHLTGTRAVNAEYERLGQPAVSLDDIRHFRQLGSKAPGHPEYHLVSGVEATTGPLGQGVATSVGMAIAEKWLANRYNRPGFEIFDYNIYAVCGDGCMMEGVASEAASFAGHLALDNLCWIYDNNHITIEGNTRITFTEDIAARFLGYGWNVLRVGDANDIDRIEHALDIFRKTKERPTFIILDSHIGYGSPHKQDTAAAHGEPLGEEEVRLAKRDYGWPEDAKFLVPEAVREHFAAGIGARGRAGPSPLGRTLRRLSRRNIRSSRPRLI